MEPSAPSPEAPPAAPAARRGDRTLPVVLLIAAAIVGAVLAAMRQRSVDEAAPTQADSENAATVSWSPTPRPTGATASLTIDFGNGARREFAALPHRDGMTVGDLMRAARDFRPSIRYTHKGLGEMSFLTSLEGVANEGNDGRNWLYGVDGKPGEVSFEIQPLAAGAAVLWEFRSGE